MTPKIVLALDNVHMGLSHVGLADIAKRFGGVHLSKLAAGELVLFLNRKRDRLKVIGSQGQVLAYVRLLDGRRIPLEAIQYIPRTFARAGRLDLDAAISEHVTKRFLNHAKGTSTFVM